MHGYGPCTKCGLIEFRREAVRHGVDRLNDLGWTIAGGVVYCPTHTARSGDGVPLDPETYDDCLDDLDVAEIVIECEHEDCDARETLVVPTREEMECAMEYAYTRGWNDAVHKMQMKLAEWKREWGGSPMVPMSGSTDG